jgi:hypothetical protein
LEEKNMIIKNNFLEEKNMNIKNENIEKAIAQLEYVILSEKFKVLFTLQRKSLGLEGPVELVPYSVAVRIAILLKNALNLKTLQIALARRLIYAAAKVNKRTSNTLIEDILAGKNRYHYNSYI